MSIRASVSFLSFLSLSLSLSRLCALPHPSSPSIPLLILTPRRGAGVACVTTRRLYFQSFSSILDTQVSHPLLILVLVLVLVLAILLPPTRSFWFFPPPLPPPPPAPSSSWGTAFARAHVLSLWRVHQRGRRSVLTDWKPRIENGHSIAD
eukprot:1489631-Rhodomonas_salina.2